MTINGTMFAVWQHTLEGTLVPVPARDDRDRAGALFDELIGALDGVLAEQAAARLAISDAESEQAIIEASLILTTEGGNADERKARLTLALRDDPGYAELACTARDARVALFLTERRLTVIKARTVLVCAALVLLTADHQS